jgi:hypothetical protein
LNDATIIMILLHIVIVFIFLKEGNSTDDVTHNNVSRLVAVLYWYTLN